MLIQKKGYSIDEFVKKVCLIGNYDEEIIRSYIEAGGVPHLQSPDVPKSFSMASVLGIKFHELFRD